MRSYPRNSPQAAARIVSLALLADGHLCKEELDALDRIGAHEQLGLTRTDMHDVTHAFCQDLLSSMHLAWEDACRIDPRTLAEFMAEIDDPHLRMTVLRLCQAVVEADRHVADGESIVMEAAVEHWGLHADMFRTPSEDRLAAAVG